MMGALSTATLFRNGSPVLVGDADDGSALIAASPGSIAPEQLARLQTLGNGTVVLGMSRHVAERLRLPAPTRVTTAGEQMRLMTTIDAARSVDGGWSLHDRALAMRVAADPSSGAGSLTSPGHVIAGQIETESPGAAAAALELARLAGLEAVVALCPVLDEEGRIAPPEAVLDTPRLGRLPRVSSTELHAHAATRRAGELAVTCELPTRDGRFRAVGFGEGEGDETTIAFVHGDPTASPDPVVHVHVACRLGDVFGSLLCGCRADLDDAVRRIVAAGCGVIVYTQPSVASFMECTRDRGFDRARAAGLLRALGVSASPEVLRPREASAWRPEPDAVRRRETVAGRPGPDDLRACA